MPVTSLLDEQFRGAINDGDDRVREVLTAQIQDLKDRIVATARELDHTSEARLNGVHQLVTALDDLCQTRFNTIGHRIDAARDYNDGIFEEHRRNTITAEQEREKSAKALREELIRTIESGDVALDKHIKQEILRVTAALASSNELELARIASVASTAKAATDASLADHTAIRNEISAVQREILLYAKERDKAIQKQADETADKFHTANEWRQQSSERERTQREETTKLANTFLPREVADSQFERLQSDRQSNLQRIIVIEQQLAILNSREIDSEKRQDKLQPWMLWVAGTFMSIFIAIIVFAANFITPA